MRLRLPILIGALTLGAVGAQAAFPIYAERQLKYPRYTTWDDRLPNIWSGWKGRFLSGGLVQGRDPTSSAVANVSEGQAYGMLLALWMGDQATFDAIWSSTESQFWNGSCGTGGYYAWKLPWSGCSGQGSYAPDADQDIAGALIFASAMVDSTKATGWTNNKVGGNTYSAKAQILLKAIWGSEVDKSNYQLNAWHDAEGNSSIRNPSYHTVNWYPIFKEFAAANNITGENWDAVETASMALFNAQPNATFGMARNFSNSSGGTSGGGTSSIGTTDNNTQDMGFDAIRVPYRIALAAIWYPKTLTAAVSYANTVWQNGSTSKGVDVTKPGYYTTASASLIGWTENNYEKFQTRGMWGSLAIAAMSSNATSAAAAQQIGADFGRSVNGNNYLTSDQNDTTVASAPQKNYYAQSLGLLGALVISGRAWNVWDDLKHTWVVPDTAAQITAPLTATPANIDLWVSGTPLITTDTTIITATLSASRAWKVNFKGQTSGAVYTAQGTSTTVKVPWVSGKVNTGTTAKFTSEKVDVRLVYNGVDTVTKTTAKATVTVKASASLEPRVEKSEGTVRWTQGGILLLDPAWHAGDLVRVRVMEINGRSIASFQASTLRQDANGLVLALPLSHSVALRVLDLTDLSSNVRRRYVLSPNP